MGGLPPDTTNLEMYQIFSAFGPIAPRGATRQVMLCATREWESLVGKGRCSSACAEATALLDKDNGKCTGIGFINYMNAEAAEKAGDI